MVCIAGTYYEKEGEQWCAGGRYVLACEQVQIPAGTEADAEALFRHEAVHHLLFHRDGDADDFHAAPEFRCERGNARALSVEGVGGGNPEAMQ